MPGRLPRIAPLLLSLVLVSMPACRVTDLTLWKPVETSTGDGCEVECIRGLRYRDDPDTDNLRHRLDLFLPKGRRNFPVVILVHGGAWVIGDNRGCGLYSSVGQFLASRGIGAVLPNYRLSPSVKHPEHIKDVARAFAWTHAHIGEYGGRSDQLFLVGHSAGGHLVSLLATDERYLQAEGLASADIRGVVAVSGVYCMPPGKLDVTLGGSEPRAFRVNELAPLRAHDASRPAPPTGLPGLPLSLNLFGLPFGDDPAVRADASPLHHVRPGLPPFLILSAEHDLPTFADMAVDFHRALLEQHCESQLVRIEGRNHNSILFSAVEPGDPVARAMVDFIRRHVGTSGK